MLMAQFIALVVRQFVIQTVGPIWNGDNKKEPEKLADCYRNSLRLAVENDCSTGTFPGISTGVYWFPKDKAAETAVKTVAEFLSQNTSIEQVIFVVLMRKMNCRSSLKQIDWNLKFMDFK